MIIKIKRNSIKVVYIKKEMAKALVKVALTMCI